MNSIEIFIIFSNVLFLGICLSGKRLFHKNIAFVYFCFDKRYNVFGWEHFVDIKNVITL